MVKNYILMIAGLFFMTSVMGCNMFKGAGKDLENAGTSIQKTVN